MTGPAPHGHSHADANTPGRQGNGLHSDDYAAPDSYDEGLVAAPGHGAVGVFQAPQPVRPRGGSVDTTLDIDSPFLDLFGGAPAPVSAPASDPYPAEDE